MRTDKKKFSTRLMTALMAGTLAVGMLGMSVFADTADQEETTVTNLPEVTITKDVITDGYTYAPKTSFSFTVSVAGDGQYDGNKVKAGKEGGLYFSKEDETKNYTGSISFVPSGSTPTAKYTDTIKLKTDVSVFDEAGIYHYTLSETDSRYSGITYDTAARDVYVYVYEKNNERYIGNVITSYTHTDKNGKKEVVKNGPFINDYGANNDTTHDITVTKQVNGNMGEHNKLFKFKVSINGDDGEWYKVLVKEAEGSAVKEYHIISGAHADYFIKDTGFIQIFGLTSNDTYKVEEENYEADGYKTKVGDEETRTVEGEVTADGTQVTVTNTKTVPSPTGIVLNYGPYILMIALAGSMAVFFLRKKNRKEA